MDILHILGLRWILLRSICAGKNLGVTERMALDPVRAAYPNADAEIVRRELQYLEQLNLVTITRSEIRPWYVTLTAEGYNVVSYVGPAPEGIDRPPRDRLVP